MGIGESTHAHTLRHAAERQRGRLCVWSEQCLQTVRQNEVIGAARRRAARMMRPRIPAHTMIETCMLVSTVHCGGHLGLDSDVSGQLHENTALLCEQRDKTQTARVAAKCIPTGVACSGNVRISQAAASTPRGRRRGCADPDKRGADGLPVWITQTTK